MLARAVKADKGAEGDGCPLRVLCPAVGACLVIYPYLQVAEYLLCGIHCGVDWDLGGAKVCYS